MLRETPSDLRDHLERWLVTVVGVVHPPTSTDSAAPPLDLDTTFAALHRAYNKDEAKERFFLSRESLKAYQHYDQRCREKIEKHPEESEDWKFGLCRHSDIAYKLALLLHVMCHSLLSFKEKNGRIRIPSKIPVETMKKAIKYVDVSHDVFQIFFGLEPKPAVESSRRKATVNERKVETTDAFPQLTDGDPTDKSAPADAPPEPPKKRASSDSRPQKAKSLKAVKRSRPDMTSSARMSKRVKAQSQAKRKPSVQT